MTQNLTSEITLLIGTNELTGKKLLSMDFPEVSWWSDNLETVAHYYEGFVAEITISLESSKEQDYIREISELDGDVNDYTYGLIHTRVPKGAIWYAISSTYLKEHLIGVREVNPDLSKWNED